MDEKEKNETEKGGTPEWAREMMESMNSLPDRLREALSPQPPETDPNDPQEIPVPEIPQPQQPPEPEPVESPQQENPEPPKKKRNFLGWLL